MFQDIRFGVRMLLKNPSFTAVAVLSLALGIGANTAIFQLLNAVRLKMLPVAAPEQLAEVGPTNMDGTRGNKPEAYPAVTNPIWEQIRERQQSFSGIFAWSPGNFNLVQGGEERLANGLWVSGDAFTVLGVKAELGRLFSSADDRRGCGSPGAVISHAFWQREYGGDQHVVGRELMLADSPFPIIGVTPPSFFGLEVGRSFDVALPICADAIINGKNNRLDSGTNWWLMVTGRLKPGVSPAQATAQLQSISPGLFKETLPANYPQVSVKDYLGMKLEAVPAAAGYSELRENYETSLWLLLAIAGLVLLIACANLANLLLARASARARELAVRQALGASRTRLIRQLLVESLLIALAGTGAGTLLAQSLSKFLVSFLSTPNDTVFLGLGIEWRVLGFAAGVGLLTCVLFALAPALRATQITPGEAMKAGGRGLTASRERFSLRRALVVVQVALSLVLVASAILFSRSLNKLLTVDTGLREEGILITRAGFGGLNLPVEQRLTFMTQILDRIKAIPGVEAAADADGVPLSGGGRSNSVWMDGGQEKLNASINAVGSSYFATLGIPLLSGRSFDARDATNAPPIAIVNETLARKLLNGASPLGRTLRIEATPSTPETLYEIVGLVKDSKFLDLREEQRPLVFLSSLQEPHPGSGRQFLIRSRLPQGELSASVRRVLGEINPSIRFSFQGFKAMIDDSLLRERLLATLSGFFGLLALLLASIGLYGILSYGVASRMKEIGIRMALGAKAGNVMVMIMSEALLLVVVGVVIGLPVVFAASRFAATLLFGLTPNDPISLSLAGLALLVAALAAGFIPARRATKVDPLVALRYE